MRKRKGKSSIENFAPRRLRGKPLQLIAGLQTRTSRCSYLSLLEHYCPRKVDRVASESTDVTLLGTSSPDKNVHQQSSQDAFDRLSKQRQPANLPNPRPTEAGRSITDLATPDAQVSAFCRAVISFIVPWQFWGEGDHGKANKKAVMRSVDQFIKLRKFETMSMHAVMQSVKVHVIVTRNGTIAYEESRFDVWHG